MHIQVSFQQIILYSVLLIINSVVISNPIGILWCIMQFVFVIYLFATGKKESAVFWHLVFMITSSASTAVTTEDLGRFNYSSIKLFGPLTISYLFAIILLFISPKTKKDIKFRYSLFWKMRNIFVIFGIMGMMLGIVGLFGLGYYFDAFVGFSVYIMVLVIHIELIMRYDKGRLLKKCFYACIPLLIASIVNNLSNVLLDIKTTYSIFDIYSQSAISSFSLLLLLALPNVSNKKIVVAALLVYLILILTTATGKFFFNLAMMLFIYLLMLINNNKIRYRKFFIALAIFVIPVVLSSSFLLEGKAALKFSQFKSVFNIFESDITSVEDSPYIRMAEVLNIYSENVKNPIYAVMGRGYGGYFQDELGLFNKIVLGEGSFREEYIIQGKFATAHSTFATIPLVNGFAGLILIFYLIVQYVKRSVRGNFLAGMVLLWMLSMFYYNVVYGLIGIFYLFASEFNTVHDDNKKYHKLLCTKSNK